MVKEWFIKIDGKEEGPLSIDDLRCHPFVHRRTWVRHEEWTEWRRLYEVPELAELVDEPRKSEEPEDGAPQPEGSGGEAILAADDAQPPWMIWLVLALLVLLYTWYRLNLM